MSAFQVSPTHNLAVAAICLNTIGDNDQLLSLYKLLWRENQRSLKTRYGDEAKERMTYPCKKEELTRMAQDLLHQYSTRSARLKIIHCYDYQACERRNYETQPVGLLLASVTNYLRDCGANHEDSDYELTPWGL